MTKIVAHRGARAVLPENSLAGFRRAASLPVEAIEFDVHLTDDGELLVIHDATLDRTTTGSGPVRLVSRDRRAAVTLTGTAEAVPTLAEVLATLAVRPDIELHVELKADETGHTPTALAARIVAELARFGASGRAHLTSFSTAVLEDCRRAAPAIPRLVSVNADWAERQGGLAAFIAAVDGLVDIVAIEETLLEAQWQTVTATLPRERLCAWTVNDAERIAFWLDRGVGNLTSDNPELALAVRADA